MKGYKLDTQTSNVNEHFATIYSPRRARTRFPENCVTIFDSEENALDNANEENKIFAARVLGPCRSSEGFNVFYLVDWLSKS